MTNRSFHSYRPPRPPSWRKETSHRSAPRFFLFFAILTFAILASLYFWGVTIIANLAFLLSQTKDISRDTGDSDTIPPPPPLFVSLPALLSANEPKIDIRGTAEAGSRVSLYQNDTKIKEELSDKNGGFVFGQVPLTEGKNAFFAKAVDLFGNLSESSVVRTVIFDKTPPKIELAQPPPNFTLAADEKSLLISGKSEPDVTLYVNNQQVIVDNEGGFGVTVSIPVDEVVLRLEATDPAGNRIVLERSINRSH